MFPTSLKDATAFFFTPGINWSPSSIEDSAAQLAIRPMGACQVENAGFTSVFGDNASLELTAQYEGVYFLMVRHEKRTVNGRRKKRAIEQALREHAQVQGLEVKDIPNDERKAITQATEDDLLKNTPPSDSDTPIVVMPAERMLLIGSSNENACKRVTGFLKKIDPEMRHEAVIRADIRTVLTHWLLESSKAPSDWELGGEVVLEHHNVDNEVAKASLTKTDLEMSDVHDFVANRREATKLQFYSRTQGLFCIGSTGRLTKMDLAFEADENADTVVTWTVMARVVLSIVSELCKSLGIEDKPQEDPVEGPVGEIDVGNISFSETHQVAA